MPRLNASFQKVCAETLRSYWDYYPDHASRNGLHEYDGRLPDLSGSARRRRVRWLRENVKALEAVDASSLSEREALDLKLLLAQSRKELFDLTQLRLVETNPMESVWHLDVSNYLRRNYAPLPQRVSALTACLEQTPDFLASLSAGLDEALPRPVVEQAIEAYEGMAAFYQGDLSREVAVLQDADLLSRFNEAREKAVMSLKGFVVLLRQRLEGEDAPFALGAGRYAEMLRLGEAVELPIERLEVVGRRDMERNQARLREAAQRMDSNYGPRDAIKEIARRHSTAQALIPDTHAMLEELRRFCIDRAILTVPSEVRATVTETPQFMRWAFAAMDSPGPLEEIATESFYYVTPVEPTWTPQQAEEWLSALNYASLKLISIHEAYPGHYVHSLHNRRCPSVVGKVVGAYSFWEGWAHYTEEMFLEAGYGQGDPHLLAAQASEALIRNCRYICSIGMHTGGMTVDEATRFFMENAYMDEMPARKEAMRGTFDPGYLNYTLGKLMILRLREDYRKQLGAAFTYKEFHDRLLSYGAPPVPLLRPLMLKEPGGDVL